VKASCAGRAVSPFVSKFDIIEIRLKGEGLLYAGFEFRWDSCPSYMKLDAIVGRWELDMTW
jgi:hypothetical protein